MNAIYYPKAKRLMNGGLNPNGEGYGPFIPATAGQHHVVCWHSTETYWVPGYRGGRSAPHESYDPVAHLWYQHVRHDRAAGTLVGSSTSGVPTNHARVHQLEIIAYSAKHIADKHPKRLWIGLLDQQALEDIAEHAVWLNEEWGVPLIWREKNTITSTDHMSKDEWWWKRIDYTWGFSDHAQNPNASSHWDVGAMDVRAVMTLANGGTVTPPQPSDGDDMFCAKGDKGDKVEYWQLRMLRLGADLGSWGADGSYGNATKAAVASLVPGSTGEEIGPAEAEHIDAVTAGTGTPTIDYDVLDGRYVQQGDHTINLE